MDFKPVWVQVSIAIGVTFIGDAVVVEVRCGAIRHFDIVRDAVHVAVGFTDVEDAVAVRVGFGRTGNLVEVQNTVRITVRLALVGDAVGAHVGEGVPRDPSEVVLQNAIGKVARIGASILVAIFFRPIADFAGIRNAVVVAVFLSIVDLDRISDAIVVAVVFA